MIVTLKNNSQFIKLYVVSIIVELHVLGATVMELKLSNFVRIDLIFYTFCYDLVLIYFIGDFC